MKGYLKIVTVRTCMSISKYQKSNKHTILIKIIANQPNSNGDFVFSNNHKLFCHEIFF